MTLTEFLLARLGEDEEDLSPPSDFNRRAWSDCESKRRIVERFSSRPWQVDGVLLPPALDTLRDLVHPYSDHPDYREEWMT